METQVDGGNHEFEPKIIAFCCKWCSYAAADLAGSMRLQYPANVRIIQVPCTGRVDVLHILSVFEAGADGVFVSGCLPGDCHYISGNDKCRRRMDSLKKTLDEIGLGAERVEMYHNSAAMGPQFARTCIEFTERIKELGPWLPGESAVPDATTEA